MENIQSDLNINLSSTWNKIVDKKIHEHAAMNTSNESLQKVLSQWHKSITTGIRYNYSPHVNGFYMIFMQHGTWFEHYKEYVRNNPNKSNLSDLPKSSSLLNIKKYYSTLATDIDIPDITKEYISTSSRLRNSFVASRDYFVSDFGINYIEDDNLTIIKYHEAWHKYINLIKEGALTNMESGSSCTSSNESYFIDVPYANAIWVAVFKPFTTDIKLLIKIVGVMPVNIPLKSIVGNRSDNKMTTLNMMYKSSNMFYKFYDGIDDLNSDEGELARSFREEIIQDWDI